MPLCCNLTCLQFSGKTRVPEHSIWKAEGEELFLSEMYWKHNQSVNVKDQRGVIALFSLKKRRMSPSTQGIWIYRFGLSPKLSRELLCFVVFCCCCYSSVDASHVLCISPLLKTKNRQNFYAHFLLLLFWEFFFCGWFLFFKGSSNTLTLFF